MVINERHQLKDLQYIEPLLTLAKKDLMQEVRVFGVPEKVRRVKPLQFDTVSFKNLAWFWSITDAEQMVLAVVEVFFYPNLPRWRRWLNPDSEKWARRWLPFCPLIDFYRFLGEVTDRITMAADEFSRLKLDLTQEEKQAGYGSPDPESIQKMIFHFAQKMGINDLDLAAEYSWVVYRFVFKTEIEEANRQRKYNKIITKSK